MNVALRAVHEHLVGTGAPVAAWDRLVEGVATRGNGSDPSGSDWLMPILRATGVSGRPGEWMIYLVQLGVLTRGGALDRSRATAVHYALDLVADSFTVSSPTPSWVPVITLPEELRRLLNPPPMRQTAGVLLELLDSAQREVLLAAPFIDAAAVEFLSGSVLDAGRRGASVTVITSPGQSRYFRPLCEKWSSRAVGSVALMACELATEMSPLGSHAKILVVDSRRGYVGSANLTGAGLGRHVEIGVELEGTPLADLWRTLLAMKSAAVCLLRATAI